MKSKILAVCILLAMVAINIMYIEKQLPEVNSLRLFNTVALAGDEIGTGSGSSGSGMCTDRGGNEEPQKILQKNTCTKEIQIKVGTSFEWKTVNGNECNCEKPDRSYQGVKGCNLSSETACK